MTTIIRPYQEKDRSQIEFICAETGCKGEPIDQLLKARQLFARAVTSYFLEQEPQGAQVVEDTSTNQVVGYAIGTTDGHLADQSFKPNLFKNKFQLAYALLTNPSFTLKLKAALPLLGQRQSFEGGTVHFNLLPEYRGQMLGPRLIRNFESYLRENDVDRYFGHIWQAQIDPSLPVQGQLGQRTNLYHRDSSYTRAGFTIEESIQIPPFQLPNGAQTYTTTITKILESQNPEISEVERL